MGESVTHVGELSVTYVTGRTYQEIFPQFKEGDDISVNVSQRVGDDNKLVPLTISWLAHTIDTSEKVIHLSGIPKEIDNGLYEIAVIQSRDFQDLKHYRLNITTESGDSSSGSS